ncbi:MAG: hypothetical protein Q7R96_00960 [Nanoarchaeota archaeon]|nr:hypothetical protein [Nanoarchaeota archaeon]
MRYQNNFSGWRNALHDAGLVGIVAASDDRIAHLQHLMQSGLPTYDYTFFSLQDFSLGKGAQEVYGRYDHHVVVRVCPQNEGLPRFTFIDEPYSVVRKVLQEKVKDPAVYTAVINEYDPARYCGVIHALQDKAYVELVREPNLEGLCRGISVPWSAEFKADFPYGFSRMVYHNVEDECIRRIMWSVVKSLIDKSDSGEIPCYHLAPGYLEFVISEKTGRLFFVDYGATP